MASGSRTGRGHILLTGPVASNLVAPSSRPPPWPWPWPRGRPAGLGGLAPSAARRGPPLRVPLSLRLRRPLEPPLPRRRPPHVGRGPSPPRGRPARPSRSVAEARAYAASVVGRTRRSLRSRRLRRRRARADVTARGEGPGGAPAALRQRVAPRDDRCALRPPRGSRAAARGASGSTRVPGRARARRETGRVHPSGGRCSRHPLGPGPPLPWRRVTGRTSLSSRSRHLTSQPGGAAGCGRRRDGSTSRAGGWGLVGRGRDVKTV